MTDCFCRRVSPFRNIPGADLVSTSLAHGLGTLDLVIVVAYLLAVTVFGLRFRGGDRSLKGYFLAGRDVPWWAASLSVVAAETSVLTIISVPGVAYSGNWRFLQLVLGYLAGRVVVSILFLPRYFRGELITAYQLIGERFGPRLHQLTSLLFLGLRSAAEGVRVFAVSIIVGVAFGIGSTTSVVAICALTLLYTLEGGMPAVIWTDVVQVTLSLGGAVVAAVVLGHHVVGGWGAIHQAAAASGKLSVFHFSASLTETYTFWSGLIGGCFLTMASHGTDQLMVQRLLSVRNLRASRAALLSSGVVIFFQFVLFLAIGTGLYVFDNGQHIPPDQVFPRFIVGHVPRGIAGLLVASILAAAMSNLSAAVNSLSSASMIDFYLRWRPETSAAARARLSRISAAFWAAVLLCLALLSRGGGHVVEIGLSIASVAYGGLLGVFLLGTLTRRANSVGAGTGLLAGLVLNLLLWRQTGPLFVHIAALRFVLPKIAWTWFVLAGSLTTFAVGMAVSLLLPARLKEVA